MKSRVFSILSILVAGLLFLPAPSPAGKTVKSAEGVKAALSVDPAKSMIDLFLSEAGGAAITSARVMAEVTYPDGRTIGKELLGMKMGEAYSYMNSLDFPLRGRYIFNITVETGGKSFTIEFNREI